VKIGDINVFGVIQNSCKDMRDCVQAANDDELRIILILDFDIFSNKFCIFDQQLGVFRHYRVWGYSQFLIEIFGIA
jgi:hypothetical protein